jgi:hypothetical protein
MLKTIQYWRQSRVWQKQYDVHAPKPGDMAPDFELRDIAGKNSIRLSGLWGKKPLALIFGSFT